MNKCILLFICGILFLILLWRTVRNTRIQRGEVVPISIFSAQAAQTRCEAEREQWPVPSTRRTSAVTAPEPLRLERQPEPLQLQHNNRRVLSRRYEEIITYEERRSHGGAEPQVNEIKRELKLIDRS